MVRRTVVSFAALSGFVVLAFGSMGGMGDAFEEVAEQMAEDAERRAREEAQGVGASSGGISAEANMAACESYMAHYAELECVGELPEDFCSAFNNSFVDYAPYFECLKGAAKCDGNMPDLKGMQDCKVQ